MRRFHFGAVLAVLFLLEGADRIYVDGDDVPDTIPFVPALISNGIGLTTFVGETAILPCEAEIPDDVSIAWKKKVRNGDLEVDVNILENDRFLLVNGTYLQISAVVPTDSGTYACELPPEPSIEVFHYLEVKSRPSHARQCSGMSKKWRDLGGNYCYLIEYEHSFTWIEAVYQCFLEGGSLATLPNMEEVKRIQRYLKDASGNLHIGLWKHNDGSFEWVDKSPSTFRNWDGGEPNDRSESSVEMYLSSGKWNDIPWWKRTGLMCSVSKSSIASVPKKVCPDTSSEWTDYGSEYCYIIELYNGTTSEGAAERCNAAGGSLACFHSLEEIAVVREQVKDHHERLHIGLRQNSDGMFEWIDRSPVDLEFWDQGEPNDIQEQCGEIYPNHGMWNDIPCDKLEGYICSTPKVVPQSSTTEPSPTSVAEICGGVISGETGTIQSPNYPENYSPNGNCFWKITVPDNFQIHLSFQAFQLEYGASCDFDYVKVLDGEEPDSPVLRKLCGSEDKQTVLSSGNKMAVEFSSDQVNQASGFLAEFKAVPQCGGIIIADEGVIQTRNYPDNYLSNDVCTWKITVPEDNAVSLKFKAFETENNGGCGNDYVEILDGHDVTSRSLERFCGYQLPNEIHSSGHKITVRFVSDDSKEYFGFLAEFKKEEVGESVPVVRPPVQQMGSACDLAIDYEKRTLVNPHYPNRYMANEQCTWTITAPPGSTINLRFKSFELEDSSSCTYDYLEVYDGLGISSSTLLQKFCGDRVPDVIMSTGNQMTIYFQSDSSGERRGFTAVFNTSDGTATGPEEGGKEEEACEEHITSDEGVIQSPNYPANYGSREKCSWKITVPSDHQVILKFNDFKVEKHVRCAYDYVLVRDGHGPGSRILSKLCGHEIPSEIRSSGSKLMIEFISDSSGEYSGFSAEFKKDLPVVPSGFPWDHLDDCGGYIYALNATIVSPNFPSPYGPLQECVWHIMVPEGNLVGFKFEVVQLEFSPSCSFDYVTVLDGGKENSPVLNTVCNSYDDIPQMYSSKNKLTVKFSSDDSLEGPGFAASFSKVRVCGDSIVANKGVIQTPNTTDGFGYKCTWRITVPQNHTVLLRIRKVENALSYYRSFSVQIYDGPDVSSRILRDYVTFTDPNKIRSTGNEMFVTATSDGSPVHPHFYAEFEKDFCGGDISADIGTITSPEYPGEYPPLEDCTWRITVPENYHVLLTFETFHIEDGSCRYDFVEIRDGHSSDSPLMARSCGTNIPENLRSSSNQMSLRFKSDGSGEYKGFSAQFVKEKEVCGGDITAESGIISSPNYPGNYPKNSDCTWKITVPEGKTVNFDFKHINVELGRECEYDAVQIFEGHDSSTGKSLGKYCGQGLPSMISSSTNEMTVRFVSDSFHEGDGFIADFFGVSVDHTPALQNLLRELPNIVFQQAQRKPKPSRGGKKKKPITKRSLMETLKGSFKML